MKTLSVSHKSIPLIFENPRSKISFFYQNLSNSVLNIGELPWKRQHKLSETSDTLQAVFFLMGKEKDTKNDTINNVTKLFCCLTYLTLLVSCLPNKKKTPKLFFFQLQLFFFLATKPCLKLFGVQTNGHGTALINKACLTPWVLLERKNALRKLNLTFECQTDVLLNKKQKRK